MIAFLAFVVLAYLIYYASFLFASEYDSHVEATDTSVSPPKLDKTLYNKKMLLLATTTRLAIASSTSSSTPSYISTLLASTSDTRSISVPHTLWPVSTVYPNYGALLPFNRIVAYYGNFYSKQMGVLGEYPPEQMLKMLMNEVSKWQIADPTTPVIPAIDYVAIAAQNSPGLNNKYRLRMPADQIKKAIDLADQVHGIVFLDVQVGLSDLPSELPSLEPFLKLPNVHLSIDPEFSMKTGKKPGTVIGTFNANDINYAAELLARIVDENNLPPKILVVHRFTSAMVTGYKNIMPLPEVQIVMDMDGWGPQSQKLSTYRDIIYEEPVQFTGFKLFYKNDLLPPSIGLLTPEQILRLTPKPIYIQYQ